MVKGENKSLNIKFEGVPLKFVLKETPLRLEPEISDYTVYVEYKGKIKVLGLIPITQDGVYTDTINIEDIPLDEEELKSNIDF